MWTSSFPPAGERKKKPRKIMKQQLKANTGGPVDTT